MLLESKKPEIAIIICTYNRPGMLQRAIENILAQEYTNYRIIIIDDGSDEKVRKQNTEFVKDTIKNSKADFPRIEYYQHPENRGTVSTRNEGVVRALNSGAKYICFLDDDDLWHKKRLSLGIKAMTSEDNVGMSYGMQVNLDETLEKVIWKPECNVSLRKVIIYGLLNGGLFFPCQTIMFNREFLKELALGGKRWFSDIKGCDDTDLAMRALFHAKRTRWRVIYCHSDEPMAYYVQSIDSLRAKRKNAENAHTHIYILSQYVWKPLVVITPVVYNIIKKAVPAPVRKNLKKLF